MALFVERARPSLQIDELFVDSKFLHVGSFKALVRRAWLRRPAANLLATRAVVARLRRWRRALQVIALLAVVERPVGSTSGPMALAFADDEAGALCLELLIVVCLRNRDRILSVWPLLSAYYAALFKGLAKEPAPLLEKSVAGLLRLCTRLLHKEDIAAEMVRRWAAPLIECVGGAFWFGLCERWMDSAGACRCGASTCCCSSRRRSSTRSPR